MDETKNISAGLEFRVSTTLHDLVADFDWSKTTLGSKKRWPLALQVTVNTVLHCKPAILILWGEALVQIYNDTFAGIIGPKHPAALGAKADETWTEIWGEIGPLVEKVFKEGKSLTLENRRFVFNGKEHPERGYLTLSLSPIYDEANLSRGVLVSVTETELHTEEIHQEKLQQLVEQRTSQLYERMEELKRSEERYHKMIDEVQEYAIILLDKNGIIQNWNKGAQKIKQYKESEAVGRSFHMFYLPEDRAGKLPEKLINEAIEHGRAIHEGWRLRKDQTRFWGSITLTAIHDDNNEISGFSKVTRDLTERKQAEDQLRNYAAELQERNEELRKGEERYHKMIAEVQDYAIILLNDQGDIQNWNVGAEKIKGYSSAEIVGKNFRLFYTREDRERRLPEQLLEEAVKNGKALHEGWRVRKDGSKFWGSIVISALHNEDGSIMGFSKVTRDLTERKHAEDKLHEYLLELEAQNAELEQFAYIASHDLQEPLRKIQMFTEVTERNLHDESTVKIYFDKIKSSAKRMTELIESVLNYSRLSKQSQHLADTDLNVVLANIREDYELSIQETHAIIASEPLPRIMAIPSQVNQLFSNLIGNALKFSNKQPAIHVSSKKVTREEMVNRPANLKPGDYIQITFTDNGIGFDQQYEKIIFSMFQRLHGRGEYSGTGIGLALCKKIMENHGGYIAATSEPAKGASFYVYFPAN